MTYKKIYLKNKIIAEIFYKKNDNTALKLIDIIKNGYDFLINFFGFSIKNIKIYLLYSRKDINKIWGSKTPKWLCGFTKNQEKNIIYLLSPSVSKKLSNHTIPQIHKTIIHEIAHLFIKKINTYVIRWLNEGLASFLAKQKQKKIIKESDWEYLLKQSFIINPNLEWLSIAKKSSYKISYLFVSFLIKKYGKNKIIKLLKINCRKKIFKDGIEKILNTDVEELKKLFEKEIILIK